MDRIISYCKNNLKPLVEKYVPEDGEVSNTVYITGAAAIIMTAILWRSSRLTNSGRENRKQARKKSSKTKSKNQDEKPLPMTPEKKIDSVHLRFVNEYKDGVQKLLDNYDSSDKNEVYQRNYYNEMLLKLLIELDGVDLADMQGERRVTLKEKRKAVIKEIQAHLKKLDKLA